MQDPALSPTAFANEAVSTPLEDADRELHPQSPEADRADGASGPRLAIVAGWVLCSGACGLIYQTAWLRELRLVFGASTPATAATLAIFMAGLGAGGLWLGPRADRSTSPLWLYGMLELGIAASAALSPALLGLVRAAYVALGGSSSMGPFGSTIVRLLLTGFVLGIPAVLMGGTLPAVARAVTSSVDSVRRRLAFVYAINTLGAVGGVALTTFVLLQQLGTHLTVWLAAALNLAVGLSVVALVPSRRSTASTLRLVPAAPAADDSRGVAPPFVYVASALVGFVFFLMEIVWYRMLTPLLGGTTYTFGSILAVALLGVSVGSALYGPVAGRRSPKLEWFTASCALEALALAIPFALGDRLAVMTMLLRPLGSVGLLGSVAAWTVTIGVVVLPAAIIAGFQFPLLVRLLGGGGDGLGGHTGRAYAWNTAGAILGALAGGFGLLPWLTAPGVWRASTGILVVLSVATWVGAVRAQRSGLWPKIGALGAATCAVLLVALPSGPTAFWRHSGIGVGRAGDVTDFATPNDIRRQIDEKRSEIDWEAEGRESSIAANTAGGLSLLVGGKSDGSAIGDAGTQIMLGMVGALLHPQPRRALVIGLGTGSSSGWLGQVPSIERVDTIELEPAVVEFAQRCAVANQDVTRSPKQRIIIGDGREFVQTTRESYDLIVSEPSNPYRAGVASLFTREFYASVSRRLAPGGIFLQWVQAYETDVENLLIIYATMRSAFPNVETWTTLESDLLLVGSRQPLAIDVDALRARVAQEPYRSALQRAWRVRDAEGVLAHYVGNGGFGTAMAHMAPPVLNTDDRSVLEYRFARRLGQEVSVHADELRALAVMSRNSAPPWTGLDRMDRTNVSVEKASMHLQQMFPAPPSPPTGPVHDRVAVMEAFAQRDQSKALELLKRSDRKTSDLTELAIAATVLSESGDPGAMALIEELRAYRPTEAEFLLAHYRFALGDLPGATDAFEAACLAHRQDPWVWVELAGQQLRLAGDIAQRGDPSLTARVFAALGSPFAVACSNGRRRAMRLLVARVLDSGQPGTYTREALEEYGPNVPWEEQVLRDRARCYERLQDPRAEKARQDLATYQASMPPRVSVDPSRVP